MPRLFDKIIDDLNEKKTNWSEPIPFLEYRNIALQNSKAKAPDYISVQSFSHLSTELRANNFMVFRLGNHKGNGTSFALARYIDSWNDYFIFDDDIFKNVVVEERQLDWHQDNLFSFTVLKNFTETSYVNLALSSGILQKSLGVDTKISIPATGTGTYSFIVRPHDKLDISWKHNNGQVEVDAIFLANRKGKKVLFVIEAKSGKKRNDSLSKYKLVYPILSIAEKIDKDIEIVPVYLRIFSSEDYFYFYVSECSIPDPRTENLHINQLCVEKVSIIKTLKSF